jgi:hypothetical protein
MRTVTFIPALPLSEAYRGSERHAIWQHRDASVRVHLDTYKCDFGTQERGTSDALASSSVEVYG